MRLMRDAVSLRPAPLQFLLYQLWEVHKGRPGQLFIHNPRAAKKATTGKDYHSVLRTQQQAEAAATLQCLKDSRMDLGPAGDAIADVLTAYGFRNPKRGSKGYSGETVRDWRKEWRSKPSSFQKAYKETLKSGRDRRDLMKEFLASEYTEEHYRNHMLGALKMRLYCTTYKS